MLARVTLGLLLATGCGFQSQPATPGSGTADAAVVDSPVAGDGSGSDLGFCITNTTLTACLTEAPSQPLVIDSPLVIDTDGASCATNTVGASASYCILAASTITIAAGQTLSAHGSRPLVLMANGLITIAGTIDVAGHVLGLPHGTGPGVAACTAGTIAVGTGGGYGGSFGSIGGAGGADFGGRLGGVPPVLVAPTTFRGGCPGEAALDGGGVAGTAGGALAVLSTTQIQIDGVIDASGGGGGGSTVNNNRGGAGGGAGGMIVIDAPVVAGGPGTKIFANGGSGGEGSGGEKGVNGHDPLDPATAAAGASGISSGGDGGTGAITDAAAGNAAGAGLPGTSAAGGGGGGGGVGVIKLYRAQALPGAVSPPAR